MLKRTKNRNQFLGLFFLIVFITFLLYLFIFSKKAYKSLPSLPSITFETACVQLENQIGMLIEKGNVCNIDQDCVINSFGCPFGCYSLTHEKAAQKIKEGVAKFDTSCTSCDYRCASPPKTGEIKCINNRCTDTKFNY